MSSHQSIASIVTINYNNESGISKTLKSLKENAHNDVELILIDGGSTDNSCQIINENLTSLSQNFAKVVFISELDNGIYDAMNKGLAHATGVYVGFLNSGDTFAYSEALRDVTDFITINSFPDGVFCNLNFLNKDDVISRVWSSGSFDVRKFYYGWMPPHPTTYLSRKKLESIGIFDCDFKIAADYDLLLRFCVVAGHKLLKLDVTLVNMEDGGVSNQNVLSVLHSNLEVCSSWKKNFGLYPVWLLFLKPLSKILQLKLFRKLMTNVRR